MSRITSLESPSVPRANPRLFFALSAGACLALLAAAYYLQFVRHLDPCPMCIFQRLCYMAIVVVAVAGAVHGPRGWGVYAYAVPAALAALTGAAIAARQVWLQHLPAERVPECGPGLEYMLEVYPLGDAIRKALSGSGECAAVDWTLLGLSIAEWSLICFCTIFVAYIGFMWIHAAKRAR